MVVVASAGFVNSVLVIGACSGACDEQSVSYSFDVLQEPGAYDCDCDCEWGLTVFTTRDLGGWCCC